MDAWADLMVHLLAFLKILTTALHELQKNPSSRCCPYPRHEMWVNGAQVILAALLLAAMEVKASEAVAAVAVSVMKVVLVATEVKAARTEVTEGR